MNVYIGLNGHVRIGFSPGTVREVKGFGFFMLHDEPKFGEGDGIFRIHLGEQINISRE